MSDEPRRSVRATKGQHKSLDALEQAQEVAPKKGRGKKNGKKSESQEPASAAEEEDIIRCICGAIEQDDNLDEKWISCEKCNVWQHNICMGITIDEQELESLEYFCEDCKPEHHKETLAAIKRGEKPWEARQAAYEESLAEAKGKKKKSKGKRVSDPKPVEKNGKVSTASTPAPEVKKETKKEPVARANSVKRKAEESQDGASKAKVRRVSTQDGPAKPSAAMPPATPSDIPSTIQQLNTRRQASAKYILKQLTAAMKISKDNGIFEVSDPELDAKAMRLTLEIERAIFDTMPTEAVHAEQCRRIGLNLKTNQELADKLVTKKLKPNVFAVMTGDEMASKQLQKQSAEMQARNDKQAILVNDDGPRFRSTHKGVEQIDTQSALDLDDPMGPRRRSGVIDPNLGMGARSRENSIGDGGEQPEPAEHYKSKDDIKAQVAPTGPLSLNTSGSPPPLKKQPSQPVDFDINKVFSSVQSPTVLNHGRKPSVQAVQTPVKEAPVEDADIDRMLEDPTDSPPYSPAEFDHDPSIVWRGQMIMSNVASFSAVGRHIGGADLTLVNEPISFSELIPSKLAVAGRIEKEKAEEYLCSLRFSKGTDVVVVALSAAGGAGEEEFMKLYNYFNEKNRYGVVGTKSFANTRDTYLIPVSAGTGEIPEFMMNLDNNKLPGERPEPMMLVVLVVRFGASQSSDRPVGQPERQISFSGQGPAMSPIAQQGNFSQSPAQTPQHAYHPQQGYGGAQGYGGPHPTQHAKPDPRDIAQQKGEISARQILGDDLINCPTVKFLLPNAHVMQPSEWNVIKDILVNNEAARTDLPYLSKLLEQKAPEKTM